MSLRYLLDAYNIIYQVPALSRGSLEEQRKKLTGFLDTKRPQGSRNNKVTIVFDGGPGRAPRDEAISAKVIYSGDETADEKILRLVDGEANRKSLIVVSDDRALQYAVRALGAKSLSVRDFIRQGEPKLLPPRSSKRTSKDPEASKYISHTLEHDITAEMGEIWLKKKKEH